MNLKPYIIPLAFMIFVGGCLYIILRKPKKETSKPLDAQIINIHTETVYDSTERIYLPPPDSFSDMLIEGQNHFKAIQFIDTSKGWYQGRWSADSQFIQFSK